MNNTLLKTLGFITLIFSSSVHSNQGKLTDVERAQSSYLKELESYEYSDKYGHTNFPILLKFNDAIPLPNEFKDVKIIHNFTKINLLYGMLLHSYSSQNLFLKEFANTPDKAGMSLAIICNKLALHKDIRSFYIANKNVIDLLNQHLIERGKPSKTYLEYIKDAEEGIIKTEKELNGKTCW